MAKVRVKLRLSRLELELTQVQLAMLIGTSQENISRYEMGLVSPSRKTANKLIAFFELRGRELTIEDVRE